MHPWGNIKSHKVISGIVWLENIDQRSSTRMFKFNFLHDITKPLAENGKMHQQPGVVWPAKIILRLLAANLSTTANHTLGNAPDLRQILNLSVIFCHVLSRFYLWEQIHDPVSVMWIAFNGKLMGFRMKIFKKQFVCLLFFLFVHQ